MNVPITIINTHKPNEAEQERPDRKLALLVGVVAVAQRIRVYIRNGHQADDDQVGMTTPAIHGSK